METLKTPEFPSALETTLRETCERIAPRDDPDHAMRRGEELNKADREELLRRKVKAVRAAITCAKGAQAEEKHTQFAEAWLASPGKPADVDAYLRRSDLTTYGETAGGDEGFLRPNLLGDDSRKAAYYMLKAIETPYASASAAFLFECAMALARTAEKSQQVETGKAHEWVCGVVTGAAL